MNWHEIVKYSPQKYDSNGIYTTDEWTSMWDVGKKFDGKLFTLEEYLGRRTALCLCYTVYYESDEL